MSFEVDAVFPNFCVRIAAGVKITGVSESADAGTRGLAFIIAETSAMKVVKIWWVSR